jgi:flagellar protein FlaG
MAYPDDSGGIPQNAVTKKVVSNEKPPDKKDATPDALKALVAEMQKSLEELSIGLQFSTYGEDSKKIAVVVSNRETGEVIREIPSRELQELYTKINELTGMLFDKVA